MRSAPQAGTKGCGGVADTDMFLAVNDKTLCRLHVHIARAPHPAPADGGLMLYAESVVANLEEA